MTGYAKRLSTLVAHFLVLGTAQIGFTAAAPPNPELDAEIERDEETEPRSLEFMILPASNSQSLDPLKRHVGDGYFYSFRSHFLAGAGYGNMIQQQSNMNSLFAYGWEKSPQSFWQAGAEVYFSGTTTGGFDFRYLKILSKSRTRPFWNLGGALLFKANEQLINFMRLENYRLRVGGGIDHTFWSIFAIRIEALLGIGLGSGLEDRINLALIWPM